MKRISPTKLIDCLVSLFKAHGEYIHISNEEWADEEWKAYFDLRVCKLIEEGGIPYYDSGDEKTVDLYDIALGLCETFGYDLNYFTIDQIFDSPGLDIYVLSFIFTDEWSDEVYASFHTVYERC